MLRQPVAVIHKPIPAQHVGHSLRGCASARNAGFWVPRAPNGRVRTLREASPRHSTGFVPVWAELRVSALCEASHPQDHDGHFTDWNQTRKASCSADSAGHSHAGVPFRASPPCDASYPHAGIRNGNTAWCRAGASSRSHGRNKRGVSVLSSY